jgi:hypothetical protein
MKPSGRRVLLAQLVIASTDSQLDPHEGGSTRMRGGVPFVTLPAGYLGSSAIGACCIAAVSEIEVRADCSATFSPPLAHTAGLRHKRVQSRVYSAVRLLPSHSFLGPQELDCVVHHWVCSYTDYSKYSCWQMSGDDTVSSARGLLALRSGFVARLPLDRAPFPRALPWRHVVSILYCELRRRGPLANTRSGTLSM